MPHTCSIILSEGNDQLASDCLADLRVKTLETNLNADSAKDAISLLWDQTRGEMEVAELTRLVAAKQLMREGDYQRAREMLALPKPQHAESLNLLGVLEESEGNFDKARKYYGIARSLDKNYLASHMNGCRIYELYTFGRSSIPVYL